MPSIANLYADGTSRPQLTVGTVTGLQALQFLLIFTTST